MKLRNIVLVQFMGFTTQIVTTNNNTCTRGTDFCVPEKTDSLLVQIENEYG